MIMTLSTALSTMLDTALSTNPTATRVRLHTTGRGRLLSLMCRRLPRLLCLLSLVSLVHRSLRQHPVLRARCAHTRRARSRRAPARVRLQHDNLVVLDAGREGGGTRSGCALLLSHLGLAFEIAQPAPERRVFGFFETERGMSLCKSARRVARQRRQPARLRREGECIAERHELMLHARVQLLHLALVLLGHGAHLCMQLLQ